MAFLLFAFVVIISTVTDTSSAQALGQLSYWCRDRTNTLIVHDAFAENLHDIITIMPRPAQDNNYNILSNMECEWIVSCAGCHVKYHLINQDLSGSTACSTITDNSNPHPTREDTYCGFVPFTGFYPTNDGWNTDSLNFKLLTSSAAYASRKYNVVISLDFSVRKRSTSNDATVQHKLPPRSLLTDNEFNHMLGFVVHGNDKAKLCLDCRKRPYIEAYCNCQNIACTEHVITDEKDQDGDSLQEAVTPAPELKENVVHGGESRRRRAAKLRSSVRL